MHVIILVRGLVFAVTTCDLQSRESSGRGEQGRPYLLSHGPRAAVACVARRQGARDFCAGRVSPQTLGALADPGRACGLRQLDVG